MSLTPWGYWQQWQKSCAKTWGFSQTCFHAYRVLQIKSIQKSEIRTKATPTQTRCLLLASKIPFCIFGDLHTSSRGGGWARSERQMLWNREELPWSFLWALLCNFLGMQSSSSLCGVVRTHIINNYTLAVISTLLYSNQCCSCNTGVVLAICTVLGLKVTSLFGVTASYNSFVEMEMCHSLVKA